MLDCGSSICKGVEHGGERERVRSGGRQVFNHKAEEDSCVQASTENISATLVSLYSL
jgi:hypothetical protein